MAAANSGSVGRGKTMTSNRVGIPHLYSMKTPKGSWTPSLNYMQFSWMVASDEFRVDTVTEKTDGIFLEMGVDQKGFYTRHTGSGLNKAYSVGDHSNLAKIKGRDNSVFYALFDELHGQLQAMDTLQDYLHHSYEYVDIDHTSPSFSITGEIFFIPMAKEINQNKVKFVHTWYNWDSLGTLGSFVIHSQNNPHIFIDGFKMFGSDKLKLDCDRTDQKKFTVDVSDLRILFNELDFRLLNDRTTPTNKVYKETEFIKFNQIKYTLSERIKNMLTVSNKWGDTEGHIIHHNNNHVPKFKIVSDKFSSSKGYTHGW